MALRPIEASTASSGWKATTTTPRRRSRRASASTSAPAHTRIGWSGDRRGRRPRRDIGELMITRSMSSSRSTSAFVGEWTPPSRCASPSITTGAKKPGMAHDAATASATRGRRSPRPNTTRRPSAWRTAQIQSGSGGQASGSRVPMPSEIISVLTVPSGSRAAASAVGRALHGRRAAAGQGAGQVRGRARVAARGAAAEGRGSARARASPPVPRRTADAPGPERAGPGPEGPLAARSR